MKTQEKHLLFYLFFFIILGALLFSVGTACFFKGTSEFFASTETVVEETVNDAEDPVVQNEEQNNNEGSIVEGDNGEIDPVGLFSLSEIRFYLTITTDGDKCGTVSVSLTTASFSGFLSTSSLYGPFGFFEADRWPGGIFSSSSVGTTSYNRVIYGEPEKNAGVNVFPRVDCPDGYTYTVSLTSSPANGVGIGNASGGGYFYSFPGGGIAGMGFSDNICYSAYIKIAFKRIAPTYNLQVNYYECIDAYNQVKERASRAVGLGNIVAGDKISFTNVGGNNLVNLIPNTRKYVGYRLESIGSSQYGLTSSDTYFEFSKGTFATVPKDTTVTITIIVQKKMCTVRFLDKNGGAIPGASFQVEFESRIGHQDLFNELSDEESAVHRTYLEKKGFSFTYFTDSLGARASANTYLGESYAYLSVLSLTPNYEQKRVRVLWINHGNANPQQEQTTLHPGEYFAPPQNPTLKGYIFQGYFYYGQAFNMNMTEEQQREEYNKFKTQIENGDFVKNYVFKGTGKRITTSVQCPIEQSVTIIFFAYFTLKTDIRVTISKDAGVLQYDYNLKSDTKDETTPAVNVSNTTINNIEAFTVLSIYVDESTYIKEGSVWDEYIFLKGKIGEDYEIVGGSVSIPSIKILLYNNIEIKMTTCVAVIVYNICNDDGYYKPSTYGGYTSINGSTNVEVMIKQKFSSGENATITAINGEYGTFKGYCSSYSEQNGAENIISINRNFSVRNLESSVTYYAVFDAQLYNLTAYVYGSKTDVFNDEENAECNGGGVATIGDQKGKIVTVQRAPTKQVKVTAIANKGYIFVGWFSSLTDLQSNNDLSCATTNSVWEFKMKNQDTNIYAKFVKAYTLTLVCDEGIDIVNFTTNMHGRETVNQIITIAATNTSGNKVSISYKYGERIDDFVCGVNEYYKFLYWEISSATDMEKAKAIFTEELLQCSSISKRNLYMTDADIELTAYATPIFYKLTFVAMYANDYLSIPAEGLNGNNISISFAEGDPNASFDEEGLDIGIYSKSAANLGLTRLTAYLRYNRSSTMTLSCEPYIVNGEEVYEFAGWYRSYNNGYLDDCITEWGLNTEVSPRITSSGNIMFYAYFKKTYRVTVWHDVGISSIAFAKENASGYFDIDAKYFKEEKYYTFKVSFDTTVTAIIKIGNLVEFKSITQRNTSYIDQEVESWIYEDNSSSKPVYIWNYTQPARDVEFDIATSVFKYDIEAKAVLFDNYNIYEKGSVRYEDCGYVTMSGMEPGNYVKNRLEYGQTTVISATPNNGYVFWGWIKKNGVAPTTSVPYLKHNKPGYNLEDMVDLENYTVLSGHFGLYSLEEDIITSENVETQNNLYIAIFVKTYSAKMYVYDTAAMDPSSIQNSSYQNYDGSPATITEATEKTPYCVEVILPYGQQVLFGFPFLSNYLFGYWEVMQGVEYLTYNGNPYKRVPETDTSGNRFADGNGGKGLSFYLYGDTIVAPYCESQMFQLTVRIYSEINAGDFQLSYLGGKYAGYSESTIVKDMPYPSSYHFFDDIVANPGYNVKEVYFLDPAGNRSEQVTALSTMPEKDVVIEIYFQKAYQKINVYSLTAEDSEGNFVLPEEIKAESLGGAIYANKAQVAYDESATLAITAYSGFSLIGVYLDKECTISVSDINGTKNDLNNGNTPNALFHVQTNPMGVEDQSYYALFAPNYYIISTNLPYGYTIDVQRTADFGQYVPFTVSYGSEFIGYDVEITNANDDTEKYEYTFGENDIGFVMPSNNVLITIKAIYREVNLTFDANGGSFVSGYSFGGFTYGVVNCKNNNYKYYVDSAKKELANGFPRANKLGFEFVGYSLNPDSKTADLISIVKGVNNKEEITMSFFPLFEDATLYAIYSVQDLMISIDYVQGQSVVYDGSEQEVLKANVQNYNDNLEYSYSWYSVTNQSVVLSTDKVLKLRSINQSGTYTCRVVIADMDKRAESSKYIEITKRVLNIDIGTAEYFGTTTIYLNNQNVSNLSDYHTIDSKSYIVLPASENDVRLVYNKNNKDNVSSYFLIQTLLGHETIQDGENIANNYDFSLDGEVTIIPRGSTYAVTAGVYERIVDRTTYEDIIAEDVFPTASVLDMEYSAGFLDDNIKERNKIVNHLMFFNGNLTLTALVPVGYEIYKVSINGVFVEQAVIKDNKITFPILLKDVGTGTSDIDVKICITKECLVTVDYNMVGVESVYSIQIFGEKFVVPDAVEVKGFTFDSWCYDNLLERDILPDSIWEKTGVTTIYAKWIFDALNDSVHLVVKDDDEVVDKVDRQYTGRIAELLYTFDLLDFFDEDIPITFEVKWYKLFNGKWTLYLANVDTVEIVNVIDSGTYSLVITAIYQAQRQTLAPGIKTADINITPYEIELGDDIEKTYDGTNILQDAIIDGVNDEKVLLYGEFDRKDVIIENETFKKTELFNFYFLNYGTALGSNYIVKNERVFASIIPYDYQIKIDEKVKYLGNRFSSQYTMQNSINQTMNFEIYIDNANVGTYTKFNINLNTDSVTIFDAYGERVDVINYNITFDDDCKIVIDKADFNFLFASSTITYDGESHMLKALYYPADSVVLTEVTTNVEGVISISYTYNGTEITDGFVNAGTYKIKVVIEGTENYNSFITTANLIISKVEFSVQFVRYVDENQPLTLEKYYPYDGINMYSQLGFTLNTTGMEASEVIERNNLTKVIQLNGVDTSKVEDIGHYQIKLNTTGLDKNNFMIIGASYANFEIVLQDIVSLISKQTIVFDYDGSDKQIAALTLIQSGKESVFQATIKSVKMLDVAKNIYFNKNEAMDAGDYVIEVAVQLIDTIHYKLTKPSVEVKIKINPFVITQDKINQVLISKAYNGKDNLPTDATIKIQLTQNSLENVGISGKYESVNVGSNIAISDIELIDTPTALASNYILEDISLSGDIVPAELSISLLDDSGAYLQGFYSINYTVSLDRDRAKSYVTGLANNEKFVAEIVCFDKVPASSDNILDFELRTEKSNDINVAYLDLSLVKIYDIDGNEIENGIENYNITNLSGGVRLYKNVVFVEVIESGEDNGIAFNNEYDGMTKILHLKFTDDNGERVYRYQNSTLVNINDNSDVLSDQVSIDGTLKDSGTYTITLSSVDGTLYQSASTTLSLTYKLTPKEISYIVPMRQIEYLDSLVLTNVSINGINDEVLKCDIEVINASSLALGQYELKNDVLSITDKGGAALSNYKIDFTVLVEVIQKKIKVLANYSTLYLVYNGQDHMAEVENVSFVYKDENGAELTINNSEFTRQYLRDNREVNVIKDAGEYAVYVTASNFIFIISDNTEETSITFTFEVDKAKVSAVWTINENDIIYDKNDHKPATVEVSGLIYPDTEASVGIEVVYKDYKDELLPYISNAGTYNATVNFLNGNYELDEASLYSEDIIILPYEITVESPTEVWFSKYFGEIDPVLVKQIITPLDEVIYVEFVRDNDESKERLGKHKIYLAPDPLINNNGTDLAGNYVINSSFVDEIGAFEIYPRSGSEGRLIISMIADINFTYTGNIFGNIDYNNYTDCFEIQDNSGTKLDEAMYDITTLTFKFSSTAIKNIGEYTLFIDTLVTSSHDSNFVTFKDNGHRFFIVKKELSLNVVSTNIVKQYDKTSRVVLNDTNVTFASGQVNVNDDVVLFGTFYDSNNKEVTTVGKDYSVRIALSGANAQNYTLPEALPILRGEITKRQLTVVGEIKKEYSADSFVNTENLTLENVIDGDLVSFSGTYSQATVGDDIRVTFNVSTLREIYEITGDYTGSITPKELYLTNDSKIEKEFDANSQFLNINKLKLEGVEGVEDVVINKVTFVDENGYGISSVGVHNVSIELSGADCGNYTIGIHVGEIKYRLITINFLYGDEENYNFGFVADGQTIEKGNVAQNAFYGLSVDSDLNQVVTLPTGTRYGYNFIGWTVDINHENQFIESTVISNENGFNIADVIANENTVNVYAYWQTVEIPIEIYIYTELLQIDAYKESIEGGHYAIDGEEVFSSYSKYIAHYYDELEFIFYLANHFEINEEIELIVDSFENNIATTHPITEETVFEFKINRERITTTIDLQGYSVKGYDTAVWTANEGKLTNKIKYQSQLLLPDLTSVGAVLLGYGDNADGEVVYNAEDIISVNDNLTVYALFATKEFNVKIDHTGGVNPSTGSTDFSYITFIYGQPIPELPVLERSGYTQGVYELYNYATSKRLSRDVTEIDLFMFDSSNENDFVLYATWIATGNKFIVEKEFDDSYYNDLPYDSFVPDITLKYKAGNGAYLTYREAFYAGSGDIVELQYNINNPDAYVFVGWQINGTFVKNGTSIVNTISCYVEKNFIRFSNFQWGEEPPVIKAIYKPIAYTLNLVYNSTFGYVNVVGGDPVNKIVYAGAHLEIEYGVNTGYEFIGYEFNGVGEIISDDENNKLSIYNITGNITLIFDYDYDTFDFAVNRSGEDNAISTILYSVNDDADSVYTRNVRVFTGDVVQLKFNVRYGYSINNNMLAIDDENNMVKVKYVGTNVFEDSSEVVFMITGFVDHFELTAEAVKSNFKITLTKYVLTESNTYQVTSDNVVMIKNMEGTQINSAQYLDTVFGYAEISYETFIHQGTSIIIPKYVFVGWYYMQNLQLIPLSEQAQTVFTINGNLNVYAVFQLKYFDVTFVCDQEQGTLCNNNGAFIINPQTIFYGQNIGSPVKAVANTGYKFKNWKITYYYDNAESTVIVDESLTSLMLDDKNLCNIKAKILCEAIFDTIDITLNFSTNFIDGTTNSKEKATISYLLEKNNAFSGEAKSRTRTTIVAIANKGYTFDSWDIRTDVNNFVILSNITEKNLSGQFVTTLTIMFTGDELSYNIVANFAQAKINITVTLITQFETGIQCGVVYDERGINNTDSYSFGVKSEGELNVKIKVYKGYIFDIDSLNEFISITPQELTVVNANLKTLNANDKEIFSAYFELTVKNFTTDTVITIMVTSHQTEASFAELTDYENQIFTEDVFVGKILFGTRSILDVFPDQLVPEFINCDFYGWSTDTTEENIVIDEKGKIINCWGIFDDNVKLYPIFKQSVVKMVININPVSALINPNNYYSELFHNVNSEELILDNGSFYFKIGTSFGVSLPEVKDGYSFLGFSYYIVNNSNNIQKIDVLRTTEGVATTFASRDLFSLSSSKEYKYSLANNATNYPDFKDLEFYLTVIYEIAIETSEVNVFGSENRIAIVGGEVGYTSPRVEGYVLYGDEITIKATISAGYELVCWLINGEEMEITDAVWKYTVIEVCNIQAVFQGKQVKIAFGTSENGSATAISGGNAQIFDGEYYVAYVGDAIKLFAEGNEGYDFTYAWKHSNGFTYDSAAYYVIDSDASVEYITLTPIFKVRDLTIKFEIIKGSGSVTCKNAEVLTTYSNEHMVYFFTIKYFDDIEVNFVPDTKHKFGEILLNNGSEEYIDVSDKLGDKIFRLNSEFYNNARSLTLYLTFNIEFWYEYLISQGFIVDNDYYTSISKVPFSGKGTADDPYKIETAIELALLSAIVNDGIELYGSNMPFNGENTYYELSTEISMNEKYWTPIGTVNHPFNAHMIIYLPPVNLTTNANDTSVDFNTAFDPQVLEEYVNLIGCLGDLGKVEYKTKSFSLIFIIVGSIAFLIILIILIIILIRNSRQKKIEDYNSQQQIFKE